MKYVLWVLLVFTASRAFGQTAPAGATAIVVHSPDSARVAYGKAVAAVLAAGYGLDRSDKDMLFMSTSVKPLEKGVSVKLQLVTTSDATGSTTTFRGVFTWLSAATIMAHVENRELPIAYTGPGSNPTKRAWQVLQQVATAALPGATVSYK